MGLNGNMLRFHSPKDAGTANKETKADDLADNFFSTV